MVKKKTGGNKNKKKKKEDNSNEIERELVLKTDTQEYAQVIKLLGNCRLECKCIDGKTRLCHIRGTMTKKKIWILVNDLILVSIREFEDSKCDALYKYTPKEVNRLKMLGEIPESININDVEKQDDKNDIGIDFDEEGDDDDEEVSVKREIDIDAI